jgi:hypothetical protein
LIGRHADAVAGIEARARRNELDGFRKRLPWNPPVARMTASASSVVATPSLPLTTTPLTRPASAIVNRITAAS